MSGLIVILLICCGSTILLEALPILFVADKKAWWKASVICNVITNPLLNTVMMLLLCIIGDMVTVSVILFALEAAVVFIEAYFYRNMLNKQYLPCFVFSLIANAISFLTGMFFARLLF